MTNILTLTLSYLGVSYTSSYAEKLYSEHPDKYNMLGISRMLGRYSVLSSGHTFDNKEEVLSLTSPFIAPLSDGFVLVTGIDKVSNAIQVSDINGSRLLPVEVFLSDWSGALLAIDNWEGASEPNYRSNAIKQVVEKLTIVICVISVALLVSAGYVVHNVETAPFWVRVVLDIVGLTLSFLLIQKQLLGASYLGDKLCSAFKQRECNSVLNSKYSKVLFGISWSEIGLGFFLANILLTSFCPSTIHVLSIINLLLIPLSLWCIWYQWFKIKHWCTICLLVHMVLFLEGLLSLFFIRWPVDYPSLLYVGLSYCAVVLSTHYVVMLYESHLRLKSISYELNYLKVQEGVFNSILHQQPFIHVNAEDSHIVFGNPEAKDVITVFSNPHCEPCARAHEKISRLLKSSDAFKVQYIFTAFNEELKESNRFLIGYYLSGNKDAGQVFDEWFAYGKNEKGQFFKNHPYSGDKALIDKEMSSHQKWRDGNGLSGTPTVLLNGYRLPSNYSIDDLENIIP